MNTRLASNLNLRLYSESTFNNRLVQTQRGLLIFDYLDKMERVLGKAIDDHPRTCAIRFDLRIPSEAEHIHSCIISRFFESLKAQISADQHKKKRAGTRVHHCTARHIWVREQNRALNHHYHVVLLLNKDAYNSLGNYDATSDNMAARIKKAWASALGYRVEDICGLVHFPDNAIYHVNASSDSYEQSFDDLFYRISYLAKAETKIYGNRIKSFGCSRN